MKEQRALPQAVREQMAREQRAGAGLHPDADILAAFCEGALTDAERSRTMAHLALCSECREVVFLAAPEVAADLAPAPAQVAPRPLAARMWRRYAQALAVAAAIVVVGSVVLLNRPHQIEPKLTTSAEIAPAEIRPQPTPLHQSGPERSPVPQEARRTAVSPAASARGARPEVSPSAPASASGLLTQQASTTPSGAAQQQAMAAGPHGPLVAKGNAAYQNAVRNVPLPTPVQPPAGQNGTAVGGVLSYAAKARVARAQTENIAVEPSPAPDTQNAAQSSIPGAQVVPHTDASGSAAKVADAAGQMHKPEGAASAVAALPALPSPGLRARWQINAAGQLQRRPNGGDWETVLIVERGALRAVSVLGDDLWAGGDSGVLFHSSDAGRHWAKAQIPGVADAITQIHFFDTGRGELTTSTGAVWQTSDGGAHWTRK